MKTLDRFQYPAKLHEHGLVIPNSPRHVRGLLAFYEPCDVIVHIERRKRGRSQHQNNYYWGVVLPEIAAHTGHATEELHRIFKAKYLQTKHVWRGYEIITPRSTTELTSNEFAEYLQNVIAECGELGIVIPVADATYQFK